VPDDDELKVRIDKLEKAENITIPSQWIREAKGSVDGAFVPVGSFSIVCGSFS
jgi:hypothetical protein